MRTRIRQPGPCARGPRRPPAARRPSGTRPASCSSPRRTPTASCPPLCWPPGCPWTEKRAGGSQGYSSELKRGDRGKCETGTQRLSANLTAGTELTLVSLPTLEMSLVIHDLRTQGPADAEPTPDTPSKGGPQQRGGQDYKLKGLHSRGGALTHPTRRQALSIRCSERRHTHTAIRSVTPFLRQVPNRQIHKMWVRGCQGLGRVCSDAHRDGLSAWGGWKCLIASGDSGNVITVVTAGHSKYTKSH